VSGNAHQRRTLRSQKELLELGRQAKQELDARATELATVRAGYERELADLRDRHESQLASWARAARRDADAIETLRGELNAARSRAEQLQAQLDESRQGGLITRREHEAALAKETAALRDRLRRKSEERLAPKKVVLEHVAAGKTP
jgi:predicted RNase H-like nuclease (RuvC/YqgF family)